MRTRRSGPIVAVMAAAMLMAPALTSPAQAGSDPFLGEIMMFGGNFAPRGWAMCDGQLLAIAQNAALFSLLGTTFGGDGRTTFGLPDLRGRVPMHPGNGPGLSPRRLGQKGGAETVTLTIAQLPNHQHALGTTSKEAGGHPIVTKGKATEMVPTGHAGGGQSHTNVQPYLCVTFVIALVGVFPSRS